MPFNHADIQQQPKREAISSQLVGKKWKVIVTIFLPNDSSGYVYHPDFPAGIYFLKKDINIKNDLEIGDILNVEINIKKINEKWEFTINKGEKIGKAQQHIPRWWKAWDFLVPHLIQASKKNSVLSDKNTTPSKREGIEIPLLTRLQEWRPTEKDGRRLEQAWNIISNALQKSLIDNLEHKKKLQGPLAGDGIWDDLRQLANIYLDGYQMLAQFKANSRPPIKIPHRQTVTTMPSPIIATAPKPSIPRLIDFGASHTEFTIYIDEAWPGTIPEAPMSENEGVIAGLICYGKAGQIFKNLPKIQTHIPREGTPEQARKSLGNLLTCNLCLPFIFPLRLPNNQKAMQHYDLLIQHAIKLLLGWMLPKPKVNTHLNIHLERFSAYSGGTNKTQFFQGLLANQPRYQNWIVDKVIWEDDKNFGYIPYADLLAHLPLEHNDRCLKLGRWANYTQLPGYVPLSLELVPRLERLEHLETTENLEDVLSFAIETADTQLGQLVMNDVASRLQDQPNLQQRLLDNLETLYQNKVRDLNRLRRQFKVVKELIPALPNQASPHIRLLWYLLALQDADHDGDPDRIRDAASHYQADRDALRDTDRELCAYTDLNLAVHYADRFEFAQAEAIIRQWVDDTLFPALSWRQRGRMYSSLGQYRAMSGLADDAENYFTQALAAFEKATLTETERAGEWQQTSIYRAINAMDGMLAEARARVEDVLGSLSEAAISLAHDDSITNQYRHYLLVRTLYLLADEVRAARDAYLEYQTSWSEGAPQHPWPLIYGYRGLLLFHFGDGSAATHNVAQQWFKRAIDIAELAMHGATVKLIGAMIATVAACCYNNQDFIDQGRRLLTAARALPGADFAIQELEHILANPNPSAIADALAALPFNYH